MIKEPLDSKFKPKKDQDIISTMKGNGIPSRFLQASIADFPNFEFHYPPISQYIYGTTGVGKTRLLCAIGRLLTTYRKINPSWKFISSSELLLTIKKTYDKDCKESEYKLIDLYSTVDILLFDDFGTEKITDWSLQIFYLILNRRYEEELTTIISSNYPQCDLADYVGDRITSRIVGMCSPMKLKGKDRRI